MKKVCLVLMLFLLLQGITIPAFAESPQMPEEWAQVTQEAPVTAEEFTSRTLSEHLEALWQMVCEHITAPLRLFAQLCGVLVLASAAKSLAGDTPINDISSLLDTIATLSAFTLCGAPMLALLGTVQQALEKSAEYLTSFVPVFASVMASCGQAGTSLVYSGIFFSIAMFTANVLCRVGLPLLRVFFALHATAAVDSVLDLTQLATLLAKWLKWALGFCATAFATLIGLQSALAQSADTLALKASKFVVGNSIPVVGRAMSDALGSVLAGMKLLKGTVGFAAVAVVAALFVPIIVQCVAYQLTFSLAAMVAAAVGHSRGARMLEGFAQGVSLYISMIFFFSLMVITATMLMVMLGNGG